MLTRELETAKGSIRLIGRPESEVIASLGVADGLGGRFRSRPERLQRMLGEVAARADAEVVVAGTPQGQLVGYLVIAPPDPLERWGRDPGLPLDEVAAFEVAGPFRRLGLATGMLALALAHERWEARIVLAPLYAGQWDLLGSGLVKPVYRRMLLRVFQRAGFAEFPTDEPEVRADPANLLVVRVGARVPPDRYLRFSGLLMEREVSSLRQINLLPAEEREAIYRRLIPEGVLDTFGIDGRTLTDRAGRRLVTFLCPPDQELVRIEVRLNPEDLDYTYLLKLDLTFDGELELGFIIINDPRAERFHVDRDAEGRDLSLGTAGRNLPEEERAMRAGLAPGQVRRGLRLFGTALGLIERFSASLGRDRFVLEPKFYHVAIRCERHGLGYLIGREDMEEIHRGFTPGGALLRRLDGSTPFRWPGMERTATGRSWALHDQILGEPWKSPRMVKLVGKDLQISTCPRLGS
jgi:hypothetical protein